MEHSRRTGSKAARVSEAGTGRGSGKGRGRSPTPQVAGDNEAIVRGAEQRLLVEQMKGREAELKRQIGVLSENCAELSGEVAKGNLIIAAKDDEIKQLRIQIKKPE